MSPQRASITLHVGHKRRLMHVLLTKHPGNTVQYMPERRSHEGMYGVWYCPRVRSITHLLHVQLGYRHFFRFLFFFVLGVKVRSISCNIGPAERAISRNMDRSRMSGIGKLHECDGHVPSNNMKELSSLSRQSMAHIAVVQVNGNHSQT